MHPSRRSRSSVLLRSGLAGALVSLALCAGSLHAAICHVTTAGTDTGDGSDWTTQAMDLQSALDEISCSEIWVAGGVYKPTASFGADPRLTWFRIDRNLRLYGGFAGSETALDQRDLDAGHVSVLSGDIDDNDTVDGNGITISADGIAGANSYRVFWVDGTGQLIYPHATIIDGFVITAGQAVAVPPTTYSGGGLYCNAEDSNALCAPTLRHMRFLGNAGDRGGGMACRADGGGCRFVLADVEFSRNRATESGGGLHCSSASADSYCDAALQRVSFHGNHSDYVGGGFYVTAANQGSSDPTLASVTFHGNTADFAGGALANVAASNGSIGTVLDNVTFVGNDATSIGGGIYNLGNTGTVSPELANVILWGNTANTGAQIGNDVATPGIHHSIIQDSGGSSGWDTDLGSDDGGNLDADPLLGPLQDNGGFSLTMLPGTGSPAIDAGDAANCPYDDQRGVLRAQGPGCDIGAVEVVFNRPGGRCHVDDDATPPGDGFGWASAFTDLQSALRDASCQHIWVASGFYTPATPATAGTPTPAERGISFRINRELTLYGSFAGTELSLAERVLEAADPSILSGDIDGDDITSDGITETATDIVDDNSHHVVWIDGTVGMPISSSTVLDGLVISGGMANSASDNRGGGLYCDGNGSGNACSPTLANVRFSGNSAGNGGAMFNNGSSSGTSSPTLSNASFSGNSGGAMYNYSDLDGTSSPTLRNVIFWNNTAALSGEQIFNTGPNARPDISFSVVQGSGGSGVGWDPLLGSDGGGNLDADPLLGPMQDNGGFTSTMLPGAGGAAIDNADPVDCPATDQRGVPRPQFAGCDIGAVELSAAVFADGFE